MKPRSQQHMENILNWPVVKAKSVSLLQDYALFLRGCNNAMSDLRDMKELDMPANKKIVVSKLPFKLREKFRNSACDIHMRHNRRPNLMTLYTLWNIKSKSCLILFLVIFKLLKEYMKKGMGMAR